MLLARGTRSFPMCRAKLALGPSSLCRIAQHCSLPALSSLCPLQLLTRGCCMLGLSSAQEQSDLSRVLPGVSLSLHWDVTVGLRSLVCPAKGNSLELGLWHLLMHFHAHFHSVNKSLKRSEAAFWAALGRKHYSAGWKSQQCPWHSSGSLPNRGFGVPAAGSSLPPQVSVMYLED